MKTLLVQGGRLIGIVGLLSMLFSLGARLAGHYTLGTYATGTLMLGGIGAVSAGCFLQLCAFVESRGGPSA